MIWECTLLGFAVRLGYRMLLWGVPAILLPVPVPVVGLPDWTVGGHRYQLLEGTSKYQDQKWPATERENKQRAGTTQVHSPNSQLGTRATRRARWNWMGTLSFGFRLKEAGPEGAFDLELLGGEEVLDALAAGLEGAAAADEHIGL